MNSIESWAEFFGWCTVINVGIYGLTVVSLLLFRDLAIRINAKIFSISREEVSRVTFQYVGAYKLATTVLCFVPYVVLKLMQ